MKKPLVLGIDIGGTSTSFGLVSREGEILLTDELSMQDCPQASDLVGRVSKGVRELLLELGPSYELKGVGTGAPNGNYFKGTIEFAPNLKWKGIIPLAELFHQSLSVVSVLTNDAKAAALGEMYFGGATGMKDFIMITLGTGLGSGIVVNGNLVYGHDGFAGELGHTVIIQHGRPCPCGKRGCLEQYCSATGIVHTYRDILNSDPEQLKNIKTEKIDAKYIYDKAMSGDEAAFYAFKYTGELLGFALSNSVCYTSPEAIFLFGGLAQAGEILFQPTILSFEKNLMAIYKNKVKILPSSLPENNAALLGAASLAWKELDKSPVEI